VTHIPIARVTLAVLLTCPLTSPALAQSALNRGQSPEECAGELPNLAEVCRTLGALLRRTADGFGTGTGGQALTALTLERTAPPDSSRLPLLPLLRWDARANGFPTSLPRASCWLESAGSIMRCAFDLAADEARAIERFEELRVVLHQLAPVEWQHASTDRSVLLADGRVVHASIHRINFDAPNWVDDSPNPRWKVLLSLGKLGTVDEVPTLF
jgi:hypothetical protein